MSGKDRLGIIREQLTDKGAVNVDELQRQFQVSQETIRRDLAQLVEEGIAIRTYGGAVLNRDSRTEKYEFSIRAVSQLKEKKIIAGLAAGIIPPYQHIGCDASTTVLEMLGQLKNREDLVVLTNSVQVATRMTDATFGIRATGGVVDFKAGYMVGAAAADAINGYNLDMTFVSCKGIDLSGNVYDTYESETELKKRFIERSRKKILLADHTKIGKKGFTLWTAVWDFDLFITDIRPPREFLKVLNAHHIEVLYEDEDPEQ